MKRFSVAQPFPAPREVIVEQFRRRELWQSFEGLPFVGTPSLESYLDAEPVEVAMGYRVSIDLPPLADQFIDPDKLTFIEISRLRADGSGAFEIVPDHYGRLLASSGTTDVVAIDDTSCQRLVAGIVEVRLGWTGKLLEGPVEDAIVSGLTRALIAQAAQVAAG